MNEKVAHFNEVPIEKFPDGENGPKHVSIQWLLGKHEPTSNFAMRLFSVEEGGCSPLHTHFWEHEVYVISGEGTVQIGEAIHPLTAGSFAFVPPHVLHQFKNVGHSTLKFLCMVPNEAMKS